MAKKYNLTIDQGSTYTRIIQVNDITNTPRDLSGYDARMSIKKAYADVATVLDLTVGSGISINGAAGQVTVTITDEQTTAMTWKTGVYDLKIISGGGVAERILEGAASVFPQVTS